MNSDYPNLTIFTALCAREGRQTGSFVLTKKFVNGVLEYARHWPGSITVRVRRVNQADNNLDHIEVHPSNYPFDLQWIEGKGEERFFAAFEKADLVLAALVYDHVCLAEIGVRRKVPVIYITEYSVMTRCQIVRSETKNLLLRWRRENWTKRLEKRYQVAVCLAAGVQCNGLPTYNAYSTLSENTLLYFDTRARTDQLISELILKERLANLHAREPLRLGFSGRLIAMKGVDHLPLVARELKRLGVPFTMDICGGGALESKIRNDIESMGLADCVRLCGTLDFEKELLSFISHKIDLFVCCHRQGDPSCTYMETYSCGVPIVGYGNESFAALAVTSEVGGQSWVAPLDDPVALAEKIAKLDQRREEIVAASNNAFAFASLHTFERTMSLRVQHMLDTL